MKSLKNLFLVVLVVLSFVMGYIAHDARVYSGVNSGIAWNRGGIEFVGTPGIFLCSANVDRVYYDSVWTGVTYHEVVTHYNIPSWLMFLVVDC